MLRVLLPGLVLLSSLLLALVDPPVARAPARAAQDGTIETVPVAEGLSMLVGRGGNIGLSVGADGALLIDDQFANVTEQILAAVAAQTDQPVRFVVNTHWHFDHTGGNENLGRAGAVIVAHENVRERMSMEQVMEAFGRTEPPSPEVALPKITFTHDVTFHWNGDVVHVLHVADAHTDGDALVHFHLANVLHAGDIYFNGFYPFIDTARRGSLDGMIEATDRALSLCNEDTKIIPGHGPLSGVGELRAYRTMLVAARDSIRALVRRGLSRDEVIAAKPTADLDAEWGDGFLDPDKWVGIVYDGMLAGG